MQSLVVGFDAVFFARPNEFRLENEVPILSWKLYMNLLQPKLKVIICCNLRLIYHPATLKNCKISIWKITPSNRAEHSASNRLSPKSVQWNEP